jgi:hypothetical protein
MPGGEFMSPFSADAPGPTMPVSIFPSSGRKGDVITIAGPFAGSIGPQIRVKFTGSAWQYANMIGPAQASVTVPRDAETGVVEIEIAGRSSRPYFTVTGESPLEPQKRWETPWQGHQEYLKVEGLEIPVLGIPVMWVVYGAIGYFVWKKWFKK